MYQFKEEMFNIKELSIIFDKVAYVKNGVFIVGDNDFDINPMLYSCDITNDNIWIKDNHWESYLVSFSKKTIQKLDFRIGINEKLTNIILISKENVSSCFSTILQKIICNVNIEGIVRYYITLNNSLFCHIDSTKLVALSLLTGNYDWERDLLVQRIVQVIGIYEQNLIVTYESAENETGMMAIDVTNGETIWDKTVGVMYQFYPLFSKKRNTIVNLHCGSFYLNGVQIAQSANIFTEINLTNGSFLRKEVLTDLDKLGLGVDKFTVEGDYIYFTATHQGSFGAVALGVLDYNSLALLWWQVVEMQEADGFGNFLMNKPIVGGDKLYILDKTSVLHIFERIED